MIACEHRVRHTQRREDRRLQVGAERQAAHPLDNKTEQHVVAVAVALPRSRREVQPRHAGQRPERILLAYRISVDPARELEQLVVVHDAGGVVQHLANGDLCAIARQFAHVFVDVVVQADLALVGEDEHRGCGELLRHRADIEPCLRPQRYIFRNVRQTIGALEDDLSRAGDAHVAARLAGEVLENRRHLRRKVGWSRRRFCGLSGRRQKRQRAETPKHSALHGQPPADSVCTRHGVPPQAALVSSSSSIGDRVPKAAGGRIGCVAADGSNEIGGPSGLGKFQSSSPDSKMDLQRWKKHCEDEAAALEDVQHGPFRAHG